MTDLMELPPGWQWDPELIAAYNEDGTIWVHAPEELLLPAKRHVLHEAWKAHLAEKDKS